MSRICFLTGLMILTAICSFAQDRFVKGTLSDKNEKNALAGVTVRLQSTDSLQRFHAITDSKGSFLIDGLQPAPYRMIITSVGYESVDSLLNLSDSSIDLGSFYLLKEAKVLSEVIFRSSAPPVRQKADTIEYSASQFKVNKDANADEMVKKMPGITVENGTVKAGGEDVRKVTIDGREFFGDDATAALRNLPAEVIDKIQVFDRLSDQAQFSGFEDGNTLKAINIVTKANMRNGQFGRVYAGYGTDERYSAGGNVSFFKDNRRISLVGLFNNVNQQNFSTEDLLGVTSQGGGGGGGQRRGGQQRGGGGQQQSRGFGGSGNFLVGQQPGISKTNAFGINFSDLWGPKFKVTGSYFFNNNNNVTSEVANREIFLTADTSQFYTEKSNTSSKNFNHRLNLRLEYNIDSSNTLIITPNLSFQNNKSYSTVSAVNRIGLTDLLSQSQNIYSREGLGYNINNGLLYRHAFPKRGRTISFNLNTGFTNRSSESYLDAITQSFKSGSDPSDTLRQFSDQLTEGKQLSVNVSYTEPLGKKSQLQLNYNPGFSWNDADQRTFQYDESIGKYSKFDTSLSNLFNTTYNTQNAGITYRIGDRDNMFSVGMAYQLSDLESEVVFPNKTTIDRRFNNLLPNLMWRTKLGKNSSMRLSYRSSVNAPSVNQLQNVYNNTNPLFVTTGNPELDQSFNHRMVARYTYTNSTRGLSFIANAFVQKTDDYIANATYVVSEDSVLSQSVTLVSGSQLSKPVNLDGYWSARSFFTFGMPLKFIKTNLNWNAGYSYTRNPGIINNALNYSNTQNINLGAVFASNISEYVDFTVSYSANFNIVKNTIQPQLDNNYFSHAASFQLNLISKNGWVYQTDLNNQLYRGLTAAFNQDFWLWNMSVGKKFLKDQKGELRVSVFDLLKQNRSISRTVTETYVEDVQTQVLQQYFMLTFSYRLRNFGTAAKTQKRTRS